MDDTGFDQALDHIQPVLDMLAGTHRLKHVHIERWRRDQPAITLTWQGADTIWRHITTLVHELPTAGRPVQGHIEVNAWRDGRRGAGWSRDWWHERVHNGRLEPESLWEEAYNKVAAWTESTLAHQRDLPAAAVELLEAEVAARTTP